LTHAADFTGTVFGFGGDGTLAGSDLIDLRDISFSILEQSSYSNGVLTVSDGVHTAHLALNGNYQLANFKFVDDGQGGTTVYDLPVSSDTATTGANDASTTCESAEAITPHTLATDSATFLNDTVADFKPDIKNIAQSFSDQIRDILDAAHGEHGKPTGTTISTLAQTFSDKIQDIFSAGHDEHGNGAELTIADALGNTAAKSALGGQHLTTNVEPVFDGRHDTAFDAHSAWANSANGMLSASDGTDAFVFKPNFGQDTSGIFNSASNNVSTDHTLSAELQQLVDAWHETVATNTVITAEASSVLHEPTKNPLPNHLSDFHFV
jgi:hypothetical protein